MNFSEQQLEILALLVLLQTLLLAGSWWLGHHQASPAQQADQPEQPVLDQQTLQQAATYLELASNSWQRTGLRADARNARVLARRLRHHDQLLLAIARQGAGMEVSP